MHTLQRSSNSGDSEDLVLAVDSDRVKVCREITSQKELEVRFMITPHTSMSKGSGWAIMQMSALDTP